MISSTQLSVAWEESQNEGLSRAGWPVSMSWLQHEKTHPDCRCYHSLGLCSSLWAEHGHTCVPFLMLLSVGMMWLVSLHSWCLDFPALMDSDLGLWAKINRFSHQLFLSGYFIMATGNKTKTHGSWQWHVINWLAWSRCLPCQLSTNLGGCQWKSCTGDKYEPWFQRVLALKLGFHEVSLDKSPKFLEPWFPGNNPICHVRVLYSCCLNKSWSTYGKGLCKM